MSKAKKIKLEPTLEEPKAPPLPPVVSKVLQGVVLYQAPNPQWVYVRRLPENDKIAVAIPKRLTNRLVGKPIYIEAITDDAGTSYRYVQQPENAA